MNIVIKKKIPSTEKKSIGEGAWTHERLIRSLTPKPRGHSEFLRFQIKHKYKRRVDQGAKRYAMRVLLIFIIKKGRQNIYLSNR